MYDDVDDDDDYEDDDDDVPNSYKFLKVYDCLLTFGDQLQQQLCLKNTCSACFNIENLSLIFWWIFVVNCYYATIHLMLRCKLLGHLSEAVLISFSTFFTP